MLSIMMSNISIHSLFAEGDDILLNDNAHVATFQSTPSSQRETTCFHQRDRVFHHFNPLPLRRGRRSLRMDRNRRKRFQSTPSSQRETISARFCLTRFSSFQSTPSSQRETLCRRPYGALQATFQSTPSSQRETAKTHKNTSCPLTYYTQNPQ